jgi:alpha-1,3-mannosyl-glycoprotein beta-1,2-N-acetylglucosaminyltransferase
MKRRSVTFCILVVFLTWNVMTYFFVARGPQGKQAKELSDIEGQLDFLEYSIREQIQANEKLLRDLQDYRQLLLKEEGGDGQLAGGDGGEAGRSLVPAGGDSVVESPPVDPNKVTIPVLVIACNRPTVRRNLDQLLKYRPSAERFPIIVSQDCGHQPTADAIRSYGSKLTHIQHPEHSDIQLPWPQRKFQGYYKIARHYKWALQQVFHKFQHQAVIVVEDDLDVSPDFFEYFAATYPILRADPSLWCVSAWNDNGKANMVSNEPELLYRTDFFPGLGWMLERKTWLEIEDKWPKTFWDDWMRHPDQRKDRACIRPEISRTSTFGKIGVSRGQYFEKHLKYIKLNDKFVPFTQKDLSYLMKEKYDEDFVKMLYGLPLLSIGQAVSGSQKEHNAIRVQYTDKQSFKSQAKQLGIMDDFKSGVPRAGYRGTVSFMLKGRRTFFAPPANWRGYDITWN